MLSSGTALPCKDNEETGNLDSVLKFKVREEDK